MIDDGFAPSGREPPKGVPAFVPPLGCSVVYDYEWDDGSPAFKVCRWDAANGSDNKRFQQWSIAGDRWVPKQVIPAGKRPLWNLPALIAAPKAKVLVVEGEKAATAAASLLPPGWVVTTMAGGVAGVRGAEWSPLTARDVRIWPDNDVPGLTAAKNIQALLTHARIVDVPFNFPKGWDLADQSPPGWDTARLIGLLDEAPSQGSKERGESRRETDADYPEPDMSLLQNTRHKAPPFPVDLFGPWAPWVKQTAAGAASPVDYVAGGLFATGASLIGNARWVRAWNSWTETAAIWVALVGSPSSNKSPATDSTKRILRDIENGLAIPFQDDLRKWKALEEAAHCRHTAWEGAVAQAVKTGKNPPPLPVDADAPPKPGRPRLVVSDTTQEKLCALMEAQPKGLLQERDELAGWLLGMDRYGGNGSDRAFYLEAFGGRAYSVDRVKHDKPIIIPHLTLSVVGCIQPDKLNSALMAGDDDGLAARFLYLWPDRVEARRPTEFADTEFARSALERLSAMKLATDTDGNARPHCVPLCETAVTLFESWWRKHSAMVDGEFGLLASHLGKYPGLVLRLALVLEFLWWSGSGTDPEPGAISETAVKAAIGLAIDYFIPMAHRAFGDAALPPDERNAIALARWIIKTKPEKFNGRTLYRSREVPGITDAARMTAAADHLIDDGWLTEPQRAARAGRGRSDYLVNPRVYVARRP